MICERSSELEERSLSMCSMPAMRSSIGWVTLVSMICAEAPAVARLHGHDRRIDVRQLANALPQPRESDEPDHQQHQAEHGGEDRAVDRELGDQHRFGAAALWRSRSLQCSPMNEVDIVVAGAGVIGLAVARALAMSGREVVILEAADAFGTGTSSRNSEVIHAGIYYPRGSLKARLCVVGRSGYTTYCENHGVPHRRCGKLIVATSEAQLAELQKIQAAAAANGVELEMLSAEAGAEARAGAQLHRGAAARPLRASSTPTRTCFLCSAKRRGTARLWCVTAR